MKKRVVLKDIAEEAGVSIATVSLALSGSDRVSPETAKKVVEIARRLQYVPKARAGKRTRTAGYVIGFVLPDIMNSFYAELALHVGVELEQHGASLIVCNTNLSEEMEKSYIDMAKQGFMDAIIFASSGNFSPSISEADIKNLHANYLPVLAVHRETQFGFIPTIDSDRKNGMVKIIHHLAELGHRDIAFIGGYNEEGDCATLLSGFTEALQDLGLPVRQEWIMDGHYSMQGGFDQMQRLLELSRRPTAVACANDIMACGALRAVSKAGLKVPDDIALTGFDNSEVSRYTTPSLTTVDMCLADVGRTAAQTILTMLKNQSVPAVQIYPAEIIVRESTVKSA